MVATGAILRGAWVAMASTLVDNGRRRRQQVCVHPLTRDRRSITPTINLSGHRYGYKYARHSGGGSPTTIPRRPSWSAVG